MFYISYLDDLDVASAERNKPLECGDAIFLILFEVQNNLLGSTNTSVVNSITQMPHTHTQLRLQIEIPQCCNTHSGTPGTLNQDALCN